MHSIPYLPGEDACLTAAEGNTPRLESLLRSGINPEIQHEDTHYTPLYDATSNGHYDCMRLLIRYSARVRVKSRGHDTRSPLDIRLYDPESLEILKKGRDY